MRQRRGAVVMAMATTAPALARTRTLALVLGGLGAACTVPPSTLAPADGQAPFASSQVKPPPSGRGPLELEPELGPAHVRAARREQQRLYFASRRDPGEKRRLLGEAGDPLRAHLRELRAGAIPHLAVRVRAGQTLVAETRHLSPDADTVLHLWSDVERREVAADDDGGAEPGASRLVYTAPQDAELVLLLHAYAAADEGRCDVYVDGERARADLKFGGTTLAVAARRALHVVLLKDSPAGRAARDTLLLVLDATGALLALDDDSGVELGSELVVGVGDGVGVVVGVGGDGNGGGGNGGGVGGDGNGGGGNGGGGGDGGALAVVGAYSADDEGRARFVVNDAPQADADGDGLGDALEAALCLCGGVARACGFDCSGVATPEDTDGDGLSDAAELLGVKHPSYPQLLPRWGADPRHKDLFVEIDLADWDGQEAGRPVRHFGRPPSTEDAHAAARPFAQLSAMGNPDGEDGVRLHLDVGHPCGELPGGIDDVCGDLCAYGRDGQLRCGQSRYAGPPAERRGALSPARRHLFHVAVADCLVAGQSPGGAADSLEYDCDRFTALVHELGHNVGLDHHYGTPQTGGGNCKPNYPSVMNYAYSDRFAGGLQLQFSTGALLGAGDLDGRDLDETRSPGGDDADIDLSFLAHRPFYYTLHECRAPGRGCKVDFNRDGRLDPSVRAYLSPMPGYGFICEGAHGNALGSENLEGLAASSGPALAELPRRRDDGSLAVALHAFAPTAGAAGATLRVNHSFATTGGWQGWRDLAGPPLRAAAQPAALTLGAPGDERIWVFACVDGPQPVHYATVDRDGQSTALQAVPAQSAALRARDVSAARRGDELLLLVRDDSVAGADRVLVARRDAAGWTWAPFVAEGVPLRSTVTPALAVGPDGRIYVVTADPDPPLGTGPPGRLHLYSAATLPGELRDEELEGLRFEDGRAGLEHVLWSRPALVFAPHRDGARQPLSDGRGALVLWWTRGTRTRFLTTWGQLDERGARFSLGRWHHYEAYGYTDAIAGSSPALLVRADGHLAAAIAQSSFEPGKVRHIPFADGVPDEQLVLRDFDDRPRIRDSLCRALNWECPARCARLADPCIVSTAALPEVRCSLPRGPLPGDDGVFEEEP